MNSKSERLSQLFSQILNQKKMNNKIISIGYIGCKKCYLNINKEEAIKKYCKSEKITEEEFDDDFDIDLYTIVFEDVFECYDIWE